MPISSHRLCSGWASSMKARATRSTRPSTTAGSWTSGRTPTRTYSRAPPKRESASTISIGRRADAPGLPHWLARRRHHAERAHVGDDVSIMLTGVRGAVHQRPERGPFAGERLDRPLHRVGIAQRIRLFAVLSGGLERRDQLALPRDGPFDLVRCRRVFAE